MPGMKMGEIQEKNERIVQISFWLRNSLSHLKKKAINNNINNNIYKKFKPDTKSYAIDIPIDSLYL